MECKTCKLKKDIKIIEVYGMKVPECLDEYQSRVDDIGCKNYERIEQQIKNKD